MSENLLPELEKLLSQKRSKSYYATKLGISITEVEELLEEIRTQNILGQAKIVKYSGPELIGLDSQRKVNNDKGTIESSAETTYEPKDDLELAQLHKIDLGKYKISTYWSKLKSNGKFTSSVLASLKKPNEFSTEDFTKFLVGYSPKPVEVKVEKENELADYVDVEISIADFHLDRLTLVQDNIKARKEEYLKVLKALVKSSFSCYNIDRFIFPIGNDFFNTDNYMGSTTNLTPQDNSVSWNVAYEEGFDLLVQSISILATIGNNVEVILVQGNHDRTKSYYLTHALEVFFKDNTKVFFKRDHSTTKFTVTGNTFIGYHHGNCKIDDLPLTFATSPETSKAFGNATYREVKTADKHFYLSKEIKGVRVQQIPSMVNPDRWSGDNNFINNIRAGIAIGYHPTKGRIFEFEERV